LELLYAGGRTHHLLSAPPRTKSLKGLSKLLLDLRRGGSLATISELSPSLAKLLSDAMGPRRTPGDRNASYMSALSLVAAIYLTRVVALRGYVEAGADVGLSLVSDPHERAVVEYGVSDVADEHKVVLASRLASVIAGTGDEWRGFLGDRALPPLLEAVE